VVLRLALCWPVRPVRLAASFTFTRLFLENQISSLLLVQHIIAPPPPSLEEDDLPPQPVGKVFLDEFLRTVNNALSSQNKGPFEAEIAHTACHLLEIILAEGGQSTKELATRIQLQGGPGKSLAPPKKNIVLRIIFSSRLRVAVLPVQMARRALPFWIGQPLLCRRASNKGQVWKVYRLPFSDCCPHGSPSVRLRHDYY